MSELFEEIPGMEEEEQEKAPFEVTDDEKAEWCLEKRREHLAEIEKWTAHYEAEKRRVCMTHENKIIKLEAMLRAYFFQQADAGLTRQTKTMTAYNLPTGVLAYKKREPEYEKDEATIIEWLRENAPELIKTKETVDWAGMKKAFGFSGDRMVHVDDETGEIVEIPGVVVHQREDEFKVEERRNGKH